jgi:hypothetical protein
MMKLTAIIALLLPTGYQAFSPTLSRSTISLRSTAALHASPLNVDADDSSRRQLLSQATLAATTIGSTLLGLPLTSNADPTSTVVVAGATGQTGRRILERLAAQPNVAVIAGVRNVDKATKSLSESSTVVRGAMVQKVPSLDAAGVELRRLDGEILLILVLYLLRCINMNCSDLLQSLIQLNQWHLHFLEQILLLLLWDLFLPIR